MHTQIHNVRTQVPLFIACGSCRVSEMVRSFDLMISKLTAFPIDNEANEQQSTEKEWRPRPHAVDQFKHASKWKAIFYLSQVSVRGSRIGSD